MPDLLGRTTLVGENDLATTHPGLAAQAVGWDPTTLKAASNKRRRWRCAEGHEWDAIVFSRAKHGRGCPYCWGRVVTPGFNDLATLYPLLAAEVVGRDPRTLHAGTKEKVWWLCTEGHKWQASVNTRTRKLATGCPSCAGYGFDATSDAWLYLLQNDRWGLLKVGITNAPSTRVGLHQSRGWWLLDMQGPSDGSLVRGWEREILDALANNSAVLAPESIAGRFDGYTESWIMESFPASTLRELLELAPLAAAPDEKLRPH
jgi:hypothetical protein